MIVCTLAAELSWYLPFSLHPLPSTPHPLPALRPTPHPLSSTLNSIPCTLCPIASHLNSQNPMQALDGPGMPKGLKTQVFAAYTPARTQSHARTHTNTHINTHTHTHTHTHTSTPTLSLTHTPYTPKAQDRGTAAQFTSHSSIT